MRSKRNAPHVAKPSFVVLFIACVIAGCGVDWSYLLPAGVGQLDLLQQVVTTDEALESGVLTDEQADKLLLIQDVRAYARDVIGLRAGDDYTTIYLSGGDAVAYNISASRKDAFVPVTWSFPVVGNVPYLGYFNLAAVQAKRDELVALGYDVFIYPIDAYSGLGFYPNPILSPMLDRSEANLIDTVIHELLHNTVFRENDTSFNESLATFVGRTGAMGYFTDRYPDEPDRVQYAVDGFEDIDRYNAFALELYEDLDAYYASDLSSEEKIAGRVAVFQAGQQRFVSEVQPLMNRPDDYAWVAQGLPVNNAWMLGIRRYNLDLAVFEAVFERAGRNWATAIGVFQSATQSSDPYAFLRAWANEP